MTPVGDGRTNRVSGAGFPADFLDLIHELNAHAVDYLLVGGYAVGLYGHVRATSDIDFFYRATSDNVDRLLHALVAFGAPHEVVDREQLVRPDAVTQFGEPPMRIDLLAGISGVSFDEAQADAVQLAVAGETLPVIGLAALRANKRASGRKKDLDDLERLSAV
ncbi:MAG: nucleotidyltransferase [Gemmatimonadetes bacterium]|nr:nucleotidyltransferase [Gemmatimonadota bacterium]